VYDIQHGPEDVGRLGVDPVRREERVDDERRQALAAPLEILDLLGDAAGPSEGEKEALSSELPW
jgi:hypothetical protein